MSAYKGPFLGFTYDNKHSSDFGIVRTSDGSRFNENLLPTQQNRTVAIPGRDETYYFGSDNTQKQFAISFAFDSMTQQQLDELKVWLGKKDIRPLVFDERKNITWQAKVTTSSIKYIPFDAKINQTDENTIYKGEGSIQFTCYQPYGLEKQELDFQLVSDLDDTFLYKSMSKNSGSISTDWILNIGFEENDKVVAKVVFQDNTEYNKGEVFCSFEIDTTPLKQSGINDSGISINSKTGLIEGYYYSHDNPKRSFHIYPNAITGVISKIPANCEFCCFVEIKDEEKQSYIKPRLWCETKYY